MKAIVLFGAVFFLAILQGCSDNRATQIKTQADGEVSLKADLYDLQVSFKGQGETSEEALSALAVKQAEFMQWQQQSGQDVVSQNQSVRPEYHYPKQGKREISGYVAQQSFRIKNMNLQVFSDTMTRLASFKPETLNQGNVSISELHRQKALTQAYDIAYQANVAKRDTLMTLSGLCQGHALNIQESTNSQGIPRVMMMEAKSAPVANEHTVTVTLDITWVAQPC